MSWVGVLVEDKADQLSKVVLGANAPLVGTLSTAMNAAQCQLSCFQAVVLLVASRGAPRNGPNSPRCVELPTSSSPAQQSL
jgi:hypothetical protein